MEALPTELTLEPSVLWAQLPVARGDELHQGWTIEVILRHHEGGVLVSLSHGRKRQTLALHVRRRDDGLPAWRRGHSLDLISHLPEGLCEAEGLEVLTPLADAIGALDTAEVRWVDPPDTPWSEGTPPTRLALPPGLRDEAPSPFDFGEVFVLDLDSDCGQSCGFCGVRRQFSPAQTHDIQPLVDALTRASEQGFRVLRLSGLDPLAHPQLLTLLLHARSAGFEHIHLYSPSPRYGFPLFLDALLEVLGDADFTLHIPLYGPDATTHDRITGTPGGFYRVLGGLDALTSRGLIDHVVLLTVVTTQNLERLPELRALFNEYPCPVQVLAPFPTTRGPEDPFFTSCAAHEAMVGPMTACSPPMGLAEILPCVRFRHERETGEPALTGAGFYTFTAPLGTLFEHGSYRRWRDKPGAEGFRIPVTPCPHQQECALETLCPKGVYAAYEARYGLGELQPVSGEALQEIAFSLPELPTSVE